MTWRETAVTSDAATEMLTQYFAMRDATFPSGAGAYTVRFPPAEQFEPPAGVFIVVEGENLAGEPADVGCGGIRRIDDGADGAVRFEVKHLWIQPHLRGQGAGRALLTELERRAVEFGADELVLDTNDALEAAGGLYRSSGFVTTEPYNDNPNATTWYAKRL